MTTLQEINNKIDNLNITISDVDKFLESITDFDERKDLEKTLQKTLFDKYYKTKSEYENNLKIQKDKIIKDQNLTLKQKKEKFLKIKKKCVKCKKDGGSVFVNKENILKCICGNTTNPCDLNIEINKPYSFFLYGFKEGIDMEEEEINENKEKIIKIKLDLLFNYFSEETVLKQFQSIKKNLNEDMETKITLLNELYNIIDNKEKKIEIKNLNLQLENFIQTIKETSKEFKKTRKIDLIRDIELIYTKNIIPLNNKINALKYNYRKVIYNELDNTYHLVQKKFTFQDLEAD